MKVAYTAWTWLQDEYNNWAPPSPYPKRDFEQSLRDLKDCGYQYMENFNVVADIYENDKEEFDALMEKYGIEFSCIYTYLTDNLEKDLKIGERCAKFAKEHNFSIMNLEMPRKKIGQPLDEETMLGVCRAADEMAKVCKKYGLQMNMHPHWGTYVETEAQIDFFLEHVTEDMKLCLDTAHTTLCGMEPKYLYDKYLSAGKVGYVHLKDISGAPGEERDCVGKMVQDPELYRVADPAYPPRRFRALGQGIVDFPGILEVLKKHGYDGFLTVELDFNRVNNYESARTSRKYIKDMLGL